MSDEWPHHKADNVDEFIEGQAVEILRLRAEKAQLRAVLEEVNEIAYRYEDGEYKWRVLEALSEGEKQ